MGQPTLYLMLGYPGAGKTTTATQVSKLTGAVHLQSDHFRLNMFREPNFSQAEHDTIYRTLDYLTEMLLNKGVSVVYDANLNRYQHRVDKYIICRKTNAKPVVLWVKTEKQLAKQRAVNDIRKNLVTPKEKPDQMFERIVGIFEPPRDDETVVVVDGTKVTEGYIKDLLNV